MLPRRTAPSDIFPTSILLPSIMFLTVLMDRSVMLSAPSSVIISPTISLSCSFSSTALRRAASWAYAEASFSESVKNAPPLGMLPASATPRNTLTVLVCSCDFCSVSTTGFSAFVSMTGGSATSGVTTGSTGAAAPSGVGSTGGVTGTVGSTPTPSSSSSIPAAAVASAWSRATR